MAYLVFTNSVPVVGGVQLDLVVLSIVRLFKMMGCLGRLHLVQAKSISGNLGDHVQTLEYNLLSMT